MSNTNCNNFEGRKLSLLTDFYQFTMMQGYSLTNRTEKVVFNAFYRKNPENGGYVVFSGLESVIEYIQNLKFTDSEIAYLKSRGCFKEEFLNFLKDFKFDGDIECVAEGTVIFPNEPFLKVKAPIITAQFIETAMLNLLNFQSLIATKASRVCYAAGDDNVLEFGFRRAQALDAGVLGARAAIIGGCAATSNVEAGMRYGVDIAGTMAHSWIMSFDSEYDAFMTYANIYDDNVILLVDTYDIIKGTENAIKVFKKLREEGRLPKRYGVRIDSGDLSYFSKKIYDMFKAENFDNATICASNDLNERLIKSLKEQGAKINSWGVGTKLITSYDEPALGGVYKLAAIEKDGVMIPKIKISEDEIKVTNPGEKTIYRLVDTKTNMFLADIIAIEGEEINDTSDLIIYDPYFPRKRKTLKSGTFKVVNIMNKIFENGKCVYDIPTLSQSVNRCKEQLNSLWPEVRRFDNPHVYYVDLSDKLYDLKKSLMNSEK